VSEHGSPDDLKSLGERLGKARRGRKVATDDAEPGNSGFNTALALGLRIGMELVVAVVCGLGIGWLIDRGLGTRPWAMIGFLFVGFAAGLANIYRVMNGLGMAATYRVPAPPAPAAQEDEED
jgi:ATP synthase protein I